MKNPKKKQKKEDRFFIKFLIKSCIIIAIFIAILIFIIFPYRMTGNQMFPSMRDGDLGFFYRLDSYEINDVICYTNAKGQTAIGRVIAVGAQTINFPAEGGYEVNGQNTYDEVAYDTYSSGQSLIHYPLTIEDNSYFVMNDFRTDMSDSRNYGVVKKSRIKGKLLFLLRRRGF